MNTYMKLGLFTILAISTQAMAADYSSWAKYKNLTLNTASITTTGVGRIPVLVRFSQANQFDMFTGATAALANGADIRVTKADGTTDLPFEVDSWTTGSTGSGAIWVLLDTVPANNATAYSFRVYWNRAGVTTVSNPAAVFSPGNGFLAVWHFSQVSGSPQPDATGNGNAATPGTGVPTDNANSIIGMGKAFDGATQFYQVGANSTALSLNSNNGPYTITAWANPASCAARIAVLAKYANNNATGTRQYALHTGPTSTDWRMTNNPTALASLTASNEYVADAVGACVEASWIYLAGSYFSSTAPTADAAGAAKVTLSTNGATPITGVVADQATGTSIGTSALTFIGKIASDERYMNGSIDELTVSGVVRSPDWIKLSYETQKPASTAVSFGASVPPTGIVYHGLGAPGFKVLSLASSWVFHLPEGMSASRISVVDLGGREIWSRNVGAGIRELTWNGKAATGASASGIHLVRFTTAARDSKILAESKITLMP